MRVPSVAIGVRFALLASPLVASSAVAERPMYYLETFGPKGRVTADLIWGLTALSVTVVVIISALVLAGVYLRRSRERVGGPEYQNVTRVGSGHLWIYIGVGLSTIALAGFVWWTLVVLKLINKPWKTPTVTIEVKAHQWWWEVSYTGTDSGKADPSKRFITANEIHIPVGEPVRFELTSADVIHSFWAPKLGGKTDLIPGRTNTTWLQADEPGVYRGQCAEYCGKQHARMSLRIVAQPPTEFAAWRDRQLDPADPPESDIARAGQRQFMLRCAACHTVRGTRAGGKVGPDLTHLMSRETIVAGMLENNIGNLSGWIANPEQIKPGSGMPNIDMSGPELNSIRSYLLTLD